MIILDSCATLDIMFGERDAVELSKFLDREQIGGNNIVFLPLTVLESSAVVAVRCKEGKIKGHALNAYLSVLQDLGQSASYGDLTPKLILDAALIKAEHAASMIDCYLIATALSSGAEIITSDAEILKFRPKKSSLRKVTKKFSCIRWASRFS